MSELTHVSFDGKAQMVNVAGKRVTRRMAVAESRVCLPDSVLSLFDGHDLQTRKGAVFQTAIIAGIMGAKRTSELIPLCHPLSLDDLKIDIKLKQNEVVITSTATVDAKTGVEMEALTAASIAALTVYDMCKAVSHYIVIKEVKLMSKTGGKNDFIREA